MSTKLLRATRRSGVVRCEVLGAWTGRFNSGQARVGRMGYLLESLARGRQESKKRAKPTVQVYLRNGPCHIFAHAAKEAIVTDAPSALVMLPPTHAHSYGLILGRLARLRGRRPL